MNNLIATDKIHKLTNKQKKQASDAINQLWSAAMDPHVRLAQIYRVADKYWSMMYEDASVCTHGCAHCCYVNVDITLYEAEYIATRTGTSIPNASPDTGRDYTDTPCPFLKNYQCSIYEYRPMMCRSFATLDDANYCADRSWPSHQVTRLTIPGGGGNDVVNHLYQIVIAVNKDYPTKDIREFFPEKSHAD